MTRASSRTIPPRIPTRTRSTGTCTIPRTWGRLPSGGSRSTMTSKRDIGGGLYRAIEVAAVVVAAMSGFAASARAQFTLGDQRAGTSSGSFLKIGVGARATGLGETFVAVANDPSAIYWNPAGLASLQRSELLLSHIEWPADIRYEHAAWVLPVRRLGGSIAFQFGMLTTELDETTELQPFGTGRS